MCVHSVKRALHRLGRPPLSPDIGGCHVPVDRRQRIGESALLPGAHESGRQLRRPYCLSWDHVCSPHSHLNMRTVRPFTGLSIVRTVAGFLPQMPHALIGLGSKLEKTSFLNSSLTSK